MADITFSEQAYDDLEEIDRYTLEMWGETQRQRYLALLFKRIDAIAQAPTMGKPRPELDDGVLSLPCFAHVIFYTVRDGACFIVRILHERRDVELAFDVGGTGPSQVSESLATYSPVASP